MLDPQIAIEEITPAKARAYLGKSEGNRKIRHKHVEHLANTIVAGKWKMTGEAIQVDTNGRLMNGHHRLHAVIKANHPIKNLVVCNLPPDAMNHIDTGKSRTAADALSFEYDVKNQNVWAAVARMSAALSDGAKVQSYGISNDKVLEWYRANAERADEIVAAAVRCVKMGPASCIGAVMVAADANGRYRADILEFLDRLHTGEMLERGSPILTLRNWLIRRRDEPGSKPPDPVVNAVCHAWNAYIEGRSLTVIRPANRPARLIGATPLTYKG